MSYNKDILRDVLDIANKRRQNLIKPDNIRLLELTEGRTPNMKNMENFWVRDDREISNSITISDAVADTRDFWELFRGVSGGYVYYGGDKVFYHVLNDIIKDIENHSDDVISMSEFENIIFGHLATVNIVDNHFNIGSKYFRQSAAFYHAPSELIFERNEHSFRRVSGGQYITAIKGHEIDKVMRLHLTQNGQFVYIPVILLIEENLPDNIIIEFVYDDGSCNNINFHKENAIRRTFQPPSLQYIEEFPVVNIMMMGFPESTTNPYAQGARDFLSFAEKLRDELVVIVDIRSNRGGNGILPAQWLHLLTGEIVPTNYVGLRAQVWDMSVQHGTPEDFGYITKDITMKYLVPELFGDGYMILQNYPDKIIEREQILILLVDRFTGSAAESFTDMVLNISNSLIIGSYTYGVLNFDRMTDFQMPRSGLSFGFGAAMHVHPEGHLIEGVGIAPDIWVEGDALSAVIKMLQRNE